MDNFFLHESLGHHADNCAATGQCRISNNSHKSDIATAVDHSDLHSGKDRSKIACRLLISRHSSRARSTINTDGLHIHIKRYNIFLIRPPYTSSDLYPIAIYSDYQKSVPIKLASLLNLIAIGCCFDSLSRIYSGLQKLLYRSRLLQATIRSMYGA